MAIKIKSLANGQLTGAPPDVVILDATPANTPSMVVRNIRLVNTGSAEIGINLSLNGPQRYDPPPGSPPTVKRNLLPAGTKIRAGGLLLVEGEITLEGTKDQITASLTASGTVDYLISGFQRDA